jgi:Putative beta barrel porin-7 (BBP7)
MRRLLAAGLGCGLALTPALAQAQQPAPSRSPVRLLGVRSADEPLLLVRAQTGGTTPIPMPMPGPTVSKPMPGSPMPGSPMPVQLGMPTPFGSGPVVTDGSFPPGATFGPTFSYAPDTGYPAYGQPGAGYPQPVGPEAYGSTGFPQLDSPLYEGAQSAPGYGGYEYGPPGFAGILGTCGPNCRPGRWTFSAEYLLWFTKSARFPALLSTSSAGSNGILGTGDSRVILGDGPFGDTLHHGGRFGFNRRIGGGDRWSLDGSVFFLGTSSEEFRATSGEFPVLARPFTNANQNIPFAQVLAAPGLSTGSAVVDFENMVWGAEMNLRRRLAAQACSRYDFLFGFRYLNVAEELSIRESFARTANSPPSIGVPSAMSGTVDDIFRTENHFYGGTVGLSRERRRGRWFTSLTGKVSLGQVEQEVTINGAQTVTFSNGATGQFTGGLLAVPGNIGTYSQRKFAVVPELAFNVGVQLTPRCRAFIGYNFLYINSVLRPGQQIDPTIDVTRIPNFPVAGVTAQPIPKPAVPLKDSDFFAQGVSFGFQWHW